MWEGIKGKVAGALGISTLDGVSLPEKLVADGGYFAGKEFIPVRQTDRDELARKKQQRDEAFPKAAETEGSVNRPMLTPFLLLRNCVTSGKATALKWRKQRMR